MPKPPGQTAFAFRPLRPLADAAALQERRSAMPIKEQRVPKSRLLRFANVQKLVGGDIVQCLMNTGGPGNFDFRSGCWPKPKMQPLVACGKITSSYSGEPGLSIDSHSRTKAVAIAARATQRNYQPMLLAATIDQYQRMPTERGHHCVFPPIVIQIAECRSAPSNRNRDPGVSAFEPPIVVDRQHWQFRIVKRRVDLFYVVQHMTLRHEQILPAVVVEILQPNSPARAST